MLLMKLFLTSKLIVDLYALDPAVKENVKQKQYEK